MFMRSLGRHLARDLSVAADEAAVTIAGVVTVNDKPLADGVIIFYLKNDEFVGTKIKGGNYKVTRVPPGEWRVTMRSDEAPREERSGVQSRG